MGGLDRGRLCAALVVLSLAGLVGCSSSSSVSANGAEASLPCSAKPTGNLCIRVFSHHLEVDDVIGYIVSSQPTLAGRTWRLVLTSYSCDPGVARQPKCNASGEFPGPTRRGLPPVATSCRASATGAVVTEPPGCHDTLGQAVGSLGDWAGFEPLATQDKPVKFNSPVWLCVSEQLLTGSGWQQPSDRLSPTPARACKALTAG